MGFKPVQNLFTLEENNFNWILHQFREIDLFANNLRNLIKFPIK